MEVREDGLILKTKRGDVVDHCTYDGIVNMTFSPKTKIICLWRRSEGLTQLKKYHTRKVIYLQIVIMVDKSLDLGIFLFITRIYLTKLHTVIH